MSLLKCLLFPPLGVPDGEMGRQLVGWTLLPGPLPTGALRGRLPYVAGGSSGTGDAWRSDPHPVAAT